ncbi:hypothetical protein C8R46DRAFT_1362864 [Mycena filopes]|nr:hypothetical protein C8R46DRAFT_1362864 [Mycena filopes]
MPAVRLTNRRASAIGRRRSSIAINPVTVKPGVYGYSTSSSSAPPPPPPPTSASSVTFAPNVTPISYSAPSPSPSPYGSPSLTTDLPLPLFPPSATPAPPPTRRRAPPGKRRSQGYVPRPPNAFMLFRADFVRQKHVPGSIETNHGSLSKIIGNCWRALPLPEKHIWETKAKHAKAEHKLKYPDYKFRPVHNKRPSPSSANSATDSPSGTPAPVVKPPPAPSASASRQGQLTPAEDERRCEAVAQLLLQGKKGEALADAVRDLDWRRAHELSSLSTHSPHSHSASPSPVHQNHYDQYDATSSKYPHPLHLDPLYYPSLSSHSASNSNPASASSPPSSTFTHSSHSGSPYSLPLALGHQSSQQQHQSSQEWRGQQQQQPRDEWRLHRRSSSVPLPNDYTNAYTFPPFMTMPSSYAPASNNAYSYDPSLTLPFPSPSFSPHQGVSGVGGNGGTAYMPPPPSSGDDSLAGLLPSISSMQSQSALGLGLQGPGRMSFSWASPTSSYPRPSFSFGSGFASGNSFSWGNASANGVGTGIGGGLGRRASSAQALFAPSSFSSHPSPREQQEAQQGQGEEDLPDADTSLFEAGFGFGSAASPRDTAEVVSPFEGQVHAPRPVHAVSPLLGGDFGEQQEHEQYAQEHGYAGEQDDSPHLSSLGYPSPPHAHEGERDGEQQQQRHERLSPLPSLSSHSQSSQSHHDTAADEQEVDANGDEDDADMADELDDPMSTSTYTPFEFPTSPEEDALHLGTLGLRGFARGSVDMHMRGSVDGGEAQEGKWEESYASEFV